MQDLFESFFILSARPSNKNGHKGDLYAPLRPFLSGEKIFISYKVAFDTASTSRLTFLIRP